MIAVDFGAGNKCAVYPETDLLATTKRSDPLWGKSEAVKFAMQLEHLLTKDDVVIESATPGSSGCVVDEVDEIVERSPHRLLTVSGRIVKNVCQERDIKDHTDKQSAEIIYEFAQMPDRVKEYRPGAIKLQRDYTSVRPADKYKYETHEVDEALALLPAIEDLSTEAQTFLRDNSKTKLRYNKALVMPFGLALKEKSATSRKNYEKIIGSYAHGYPSFYRVAFKDIARKAAQSTQYDVSWNQSLLDPSHRKDGLKAARRIIRELYHLRRGNADPEKGNQHPYMH